MDRTDRCEICGRLLDAGKDIRFIFPNGDEKQLCKEHIEYIFRSLKTKEQKGYVEKELIGLKYVVIAIAILVGNDIVKTIFYRYHTIVSIVLKIAMISVIGLHCHDIISLMEGRRIVHSTLSILMRLELTTL